MGKGITKNLVGQPIFKQVMKILPREQFDLLVRHLPHNQGIIEKQESIFHCSGTHTDTPDQPFRPDMDSNREQACLHQAPDRPQQKSCNHTNVPLLGGVGFFKTKN
ncbi:MAG: hypothetical protein XD81_1325 [Bacteroidetes bacterium 38_7]|nr:MAG: hypothetical protein XD81_1325 [Bacteroidetes bacterium 38_7]HAL64649.1 hypothetical protein [Bacteroidales bacterium]